MPEPLLLIPVPTRGDAVYNQDCLPAYLDAIRQAGGRAVVIGPEMEPGELRQVLAMASGMVLPGSPADVDAARYGQDRESRTAAPDGWREEMDRTLLGEAERRTLPVLGICYGLQSLNVWRGGSLVQDLGVVPVNHAAGASVGVAHAIEVREGSLLATVVAGAGKGTRVLVNSSHHQAVGREGQGLRVVARSPQDGVVEAVEGDPEALGFPALAVQWHPERSYRASAVSQGLFRWLVDEAGAR